MNFDLFCPPPPPLYILANLCKVYVKYFNILHLLLVNLAAIIVGWLLDIADSSTLQNSQEHVTKNKMPYRAFHFVWSQTLLLHAIGTEKTETEEDDDTWNWGCSGQKNAHQQIYCNEMWLTANIIQKQNPVILNQPVFTKLGPLPITVLHLSFICVQSPPVLEVTK